MLKNKRVLVIAAVVLITAIAFWINNMSRAHSARHEVRSMTNKMKTYCVGRYLIDLPEETEVNYGKTWIDGVDITYMERRPGEASFEERVNAKEQELKAQRNDLDQISLEQVDEIKQTHLSGKIFTYGRKQTTLKRDGKPYVVENVAAEAWLYAPGVEYQFSSSLISPRRVSNMTRLASDLHPLRPNEIPTEPGFCFERGLIVGPPEPGQIESIVLHFRMKQFPDVVGNLSFHVNGGDKLNSGLLVRDKRASLGPQYDHLFTPIFKGERVINGIPGEEASEKVKELNGTRAHSFMWQSVGKLHNVDAPAISLDMDTGYGPPGKPLNSSLPDQAAIDLWKKISGTLRLRPTTTAKPSTQAGPSSDSGAAKRMPLGTQVSSLRSCPETGVYECSSDALGVARRRVYITLGRPMPSAFMPNPKTGISGVFGAQQQKEIETVWTLVSYDKDV